MVEYTISLDSVFSSLSDPTRRDILKRVCGKELSVGEVARPYNLTFAAVSKHLKVMEGANLITKKRRGKEQMVSAVPLTLKQADDYLSDYRALWEERFDKLDQLLIKVK
jgi:DNA-binding transcriptional ArsR family regulator